MRGSLILLHICTKTRLKETKSNLKDGPVSCGRDAPDEIFGGGSSVVASDSSKISVFVPQEHQIRRRSDERDWETNETTGDEYDLEHKVSLNNLSYSQNKLAI